MATLTSTKIKNTYDALLKASDNDAIGSSAKQITDGLGNGTPLYISTTQIGIGVTPEATYDLHVYQNAKVGGNLTVTGDLTVEGTTTTIDTQTLTVEDPLIEVASNNTSTDAVDIGWYGKYAPSGTTLYAGLFRDTGDGKFKLFKSLEEAPTTTVNTSGTGYTRADLIIGNLEATQVDLGDNEKIRLGDSQDLEIYHSSSTNQSFIRINGELELRANTLQLKNYAGETYFRASSNGAVRLYYDGVEKFITTSTGITVTDTVSATTFSGQLDGTISSTTTATTQTQGDNSTKVATTAYVDSAIGDNDTLAEILANGNTTGGTDIAVSANDDITFTDSSKAIFDGNLKIYNDGNYNYIHCTSNELRIRSNNLRLLNSAGTANYITADNLQAVQLYYNNSKKFETTSSGIEVTGDGIFGGSSFDDPNSYGRKIEIVDNDAVGLILNDTRDTNPMSIDNSGAVMNLRYNTTSMLALDGATSNATFAGDVIVPEYIKHSGDEDTSIRFTTNNIKFYTANNEVLELEDDGQVNIISAGTVTNPCLTIGDDVNTGIWRPASDTFAISTGGNERMRIDSSGNVGIGITSGMTYPLTVQASSGNNSYIHFVNSTTGTAFSDGFQIGVADGSSDAFLLLRESANMRFYTGGSERMRIDSSGRVGIGNTSPLTALDVISTDPNNNVSRIVNIRDDRSYAANVGGGISLFGKYNSGGSYSTFAQIIGAKTNATDNDYSGYLSFKTRPNNALPIERMRIDSSGDVGIGTTPKTAGPTWRTLFVGASLAFLSRQSASGYDSIVANNYYINSSNADVKRVTGPSSRMFLDGDVIRFQNSGSGAANSVVGWDERMRIAANGNVGIGVTSPNNKLDIDSNYTNSVHIQGTGSYNLYSYHDSGGVGWATGSGVNWNNLLYLDAANNTMRMYTNGGERMRINSSGDVGIGTTSPRNDANFVTLQVGSTATAASQIVLDDNDSNGPWRIISNQSLIINDDATERMRIESDGTVQITNSTSPKLQLKRGTKEYTTRVDNNNKFVIQEEGGNEFFVVESGASSNSIRIDSSGNVGIGTTNPQNKFVVKEGSNVDMEFGSEADGCFIQTYNRTTSSWGYLRFIAGGGERMRITRVGGEVLINQTSDLTGQIFQVNGMIDQTDVTKALRVYNGSTFLGGIGSGQWAISATYANDYALYAQNNLLFHAGTGSSIDMMIDANHNVGIATTSPTALLDVSSGTTTDVIRFGANSRWGFSRANSDNRYLSFMRNQNASGTAVWTVDGDNGNVAIGTTYPAAITSNVSAITLGGTNGSVSGGVMYQFNGNNAASHYYESSNFRYQNVGNYDHTFYTSNTTQRFQINTNGWSYFNNQGTGGGIEINGTSGKYLDIYCNASIAAFSTNASSFYFNTNVGIGTTSPSAPLTVHGQQKWYTTSADGNELRGFFNPGGSGDDAELSLYIADGATEGIVWRAAGNSYIRIDSTSLKFINFYYGSSNVGQIVTGGTNVLYQSNSDYRLKENVVEMTGALDRVEQLKPSTYNFISQPETQVDGFMAHELQEVVPQAVSGEKDEMNEDGTPKYQGVDHSQIVPLLVGAIKELKAEIETLKAQINN